MRKLQYTQKQIALHYKLKNKKNKTSAEKARLRQLNGITQRRWYADPDTIRNRLLNGDDLETARDYALGATPTDLFSDPSADKRAQVAAAWLIGEWNLPTWLPYVKQDSGADTQRATYKAPLILHPGDSYSISNCPIIGGPSDFLKKIFSVNTKINGIDYVVQLSFQVELINTNSKVIKNFYLNTISNSPNKIPAYIDSTVRSFTHGGSKDYYNSEYGSDILSISVYCQMKTLAAYNKSKRVK